MLAAFLCQPGLGQGSYGVDEEKAQRALEQLRKEYFERQAQESGEPEVLPDIHAQVAQEVFQIPVLPEDRATSDKGTIDDDLALVLILAHC